MLLAAAACATLRAPGDSCNTQDAACMDSTHALSCREGRAVAFECAGPRGCQVGGARAVTCDQSAEMAAHARCFPEYQGLAQCDVVSAGYLVCEGGEWKPQACAEGAACREVTGGIACVAVVSP